MTAHCGLYQVKVSCNISTYTFGVVYMVGEESVGAVLPLPTSPTDRSSALANGGIEWAKENCT